MLHRITEEEVLQSAGLDAYVVCFDSLDSLNRQWTIADLILWVVLVFFQICNPIPIGRLYLRRRNHSAFALQIHRPVWSSWLG